MLFSGLTFLYYFIPPVILITWLVPKRFKNTVLLLASLLFYAWGEPKLLALMVVSILLFYAGGLLIEKSSSKRWKKLWLIVSIVIGVSFLAVFKYADFFIASFNSVTGLSIPLLELALPIGISFYTFQCVGYVVDVYRGSSTAQKNPVSFGTYVSFFPQLIAGPIVRYGDIARELNERTQNVADLTLGVRRFIIGLSKKVLLANQFGQLNEIFRSSTEQSVLFYWIYAVSFTLHIYFDFSGYSDMAIGLGRIFGFRFPENFNYPYLSRSVTEFWRRWHMTLGSWFRDYIYIPLGGNRVSTAKWIRNILVVWLFTGLWHGAGWNFVLWGLLYAVFLLLEKWIPGLKKLPGALGNLYTMLVVILGFVLFNATEPGRIAGDFAGLFGAAGLPACTSETVYYLKSYSVLFVIGFIGATDYPKKLIEGFTEKYRRAGQIIGAAVLLTLFLLCSAYLADGSFNPFLYFRF